MRMTDDKLGEWKDTDVNNGNKARMSTDECAVRELYTLCIHIYTKSKPIYLQMLVRVL